jgi:solute:Na+ symporter, SSS family
VKMLIPVLVVFPGLIALALYPGIKDGDAVYAVLMKKLLPPGLVGVVFAAFLAAMMSTVSAIINSVATIWTKDIYEPFFKKGDDDRRSLIMGRIVTGLVLLLAVVTSPLSAEFPGVYVYVQTINSFVQGPIFAVLLLGMFWARATRWGGLAGLVGGIALSGTLFLFRAELFTISEPFLYISWWSFVGSLILCAVVSLLTTPEPTEKLRGLVYGYVVKDEDLQQVLKEQATKGGA